MSARTLGRHHVGPAGTRDHAGRLQIANPVGPDYWPPKPCRRPADAVTAVIPAVPAAPVPWFGPDQTNTGEEPSS